MLVRLVAASLALALASAACAAPCDWNCKIRVHACHADAPDKCWTDDVHPERSGICAMMLMGVTGEWVAKHPGEIFRAAECVTPDDNLI